MAAAIQHDGPRAYTPVTASDPIQPWPTLPQPVFARPPLPGSNDLTLPSLKTVMSPEFEQLSPVQSNYSVASHRNSPPLSIHSLPPIDPGPPSSRASRASSDTYMAGTEDRLSRFSTKSTVSMDDPDVRIAAEALSGLGNAGFAHPAPIATNGERPLQHNPYPHDVTKTHMPDHVREEPEPLLELISQAHPWVGGTIKGSLSAYTTTKYYSPRIVQYGVNLVERNITTPVVSVVSTVGEMTGMENGLRRYLGSRRTGDTTGTTTDTESSAQNKRKRALEQQDSARYPFNSDDATSRHDSLDARSPSVMEPLPAYAASRPPSYREERSPVPYERSQMAPPPLNRSWSSQIFVSTSGLSIALSTTSRHSLRFCLSLLTQSFRRVHNLTAALQLVLNQYEEARRHLQESINATLEKGEGLPDVTHVANGGAPHTTNAYDPEAARLLAEDIKRHSDEIWQTLRHVVNSVSNYAGGALPENARLFVRDQLLSLPHRWSLVNNGAPQQPPSGSESAETSRGAHRMIAFASEGLDMITQVSGVVHATLESAEQWLARVGRRDHDSEANNVSLATGYLPPMATGSAPISQSMDTRADVAMTG